MRQQIKQDEEAKKMTVESVILYIFERLEFELSENAYSLSKEAYNTFITERLRRVKAEIEKKT